MTRLPAGPAATLRLLIAGFLSLYVGGGANLVADWQRSGSPLSLTESGLRIGVDASYPPLAAAEADGSLWGLEVDLARELAGRLGVPLRLSNVDVGGGLDALMAGQLDVILAGLSPSRDLEGRVAFSRPYFDDGTRAVALGHPPAADLRGLKVGVELGSPADETARRRLRDGGGFALKHFAEPAAVLAGLRSDQIDLALLDATGARQAAAADGALGVGREPFESRPLVLAVRRPNRGLQFAVDRVLERLAEDGWLGRLADRWLGA